MSTIRINHYIVNKSGWRSLAGRKSSATISPAQGPFFHISDTGSFGGQLPPLVKRGNSQATGLPPLFAGHLESNALCELEAGSLSSASSSKMVTVVIIALTHRIVTRLHQLMHVKPLDSLWQVLRAQSLLVGNAAFVGGTIE